VHSLSDVEQQQLEADQAAAVEREDFEAAAAIDEQLQVWCMTCDELQKQAISQWFAVCLHLVPAWA